MPIEATSPQPKARTNKTIDLARIVPSPRVRPNLPVTPSHQAVGSGDRQISRFIKEHWPVQASNLKKRVKETGSQRAGQLQASTVLGLRSATDFCGRHRSTPCSAMTSSLQPPHDNVSFHFDLCALNARPPDTV